MSSRSSSRKYPTHVPRESQEKIRKALENAVPKKQERKDKDGDGRKKKKQKNKPKSNEPPIYVFTRTKGEGHPAAVIGGGTVKEPGFKGVIHCTGRLNLREPLFVKKTYNPNLLRQALVGIGDGDLIFWAEGIPPIERGNWSIQAEAWRVVDRQKAASDNDGGTWKLGYGQARKLFFSLVEKNPKIARGLTRCGIHDGRDFIKDNGLKPAPLPSEMPGDGKVKWFNEEKNYGFVNRWGNGAEDIFFHASDVENGPLSKGDPVEFITRIESKGPKALNVRKVEE